MAFQMNASGTFQDDHWYTWHIYLITAFDCCIYMHLITCKMQIVHTDKRLNTADSGKLRPVFSSERAPTLTSLQLSNSNKDLVLSPRWMLYSKTDWPTEPPVVT
jgi:hypothetical protein